jgi:RNA polymerase sigma-70 factor (ECF subfamily)
MLNFASQAYKTLNFKGILSRESEQNCQLAISSKKMQEVMKIDEQKSPVSAEFDKYKALLLPFAYNITGDVLAAEDIVQEVVTNHVLKADPALEDPRRYLVRSVINRSINEKKMLRRKKEDYRGKWLPAPVLTEDSIYADADREKILQYSLLVLLERLTPRERAVFILKETFDFEHEEIADILKIKTDHSRQLLKRGKKKILPLPPARPQFHRSNNQLLMKLVEAISTSDVALTKKLLSDDVQCMSDGGTQMKAARNLLTGHDRVSKFLKAIYGKYYLEGTTTEIVQLNFHPAILFRRNDKVFRCIVFELDEEIIKKIFIIVNPDKLAQLQF